MTLTNKIHRHLSSDSYLKTVLNEVPINIPKPQENIYEVLLRTVVEQQLSVKAAKTIWNRVLVEFENDLTPTRIIEADAERLRSCGLSYQKVGYFKNLAEFARQGNLVDRELATMDDQSLISHLSSIKGIGKWSAEMILMFSLGREDVFPVDDLVIRNAMVKLYGITEKKRALIVRLEEIAATWKPYRSYACFVLWDWYENSY